MERSMLLEKATARIAEFQFRAHINPNFVGKALRLNPIAVRNFTWRCIRDEDLLYQQDYFRNGPFIYLTAAGVTKLLSFMLLDNMISEQQVADALRITES